MGESTKTSSAPPIAASAGTGGADRPDHVNKVRVIARPAYGWTSPQSSATIGFRRIPIPLISTSIVSPGFIHSGGV
jgi:hypothetical protein